MFKSRPTNVKDHLSNLPIATFKSLCACAQLNISYILRRTKYYSCCLFYSDLPVNEKDVVPEVGPAGDTQPTQPLANRVAADEIEEHVVNILK